MLIKTKGTLIFEPPNITKKHNKQDWKRVAMIMLNCSMDMYYAWFLEKRFNLNFIKTLRGPHITIISDKLNKLTFEEGSKLFNNKEITFYYELEPRTNGKHWWLRVHCPEAESIREILGLTREPYFGFHLTIGYMSEQNLEHSQYIYDIVKKFDLISSEPRKHLSEHEISNFEDVKIISNKRANDEFEINNKKIFYKDGHYVDDKMKIINQKF